MYVYNRDMRAEYLLYTSIFFLSLPLRKAHYTIAISFRVPNSPLSMSAIMRIYAVVYAVTKGASMLQASDVYRYERQSKCIAESQKKRNHSNIMQSGLTIAQRCIVFDVKCSTIVLSILVADNSECCVTFGLLLPLWRCLNSFWLLFAASLACK